MTTRAVSNRGAAMVMAVAMLGIVAVLLSAVAMRTKAELQRTVTAADEAQAGQLLIAAAETARAQHAAGDFVDGPIVIAVVGEATLTWSTDPAGRRRCDIDVRFARLARSLQLHFPR